jgi:pimeloyl-ACP methyl ester carboxylesterase
MSMQWWKCGLALCAFATAMWPQAAATENGIAGEWDGVIAGKLRVVIRIEKTDQSFRGELESLDQGGAKLPMDEVSFDGKQSVRFELKRIGAAYAGELSRNGSEITGNFEQGGGRVPLTLRRPGAAPAVTAALKPVTRGTVPLQPCLAIDGATQALCGTYEVYENRASRTGRKIALNLTILPAVAEKPAADAVFAFAGGPGQSAVTAFPLASYVQALRQQRDVVLIDQRGTGKSNPLRCPFDRNDVQLLINGSYSTENLPACRAELEKRADLTQYTTSNAADDVDDVREALGYGKIDLLGGSYGSLAALVYLRRHSEHVRAMAIQGVVPPDYRMPLPFAKTIQSALDRLFANCAADAGCHKDFPDLKTEFETIVKRLDSQPAKFDLPAAASDKPQPVTLSRGTFVSDLRPMLYQPAVVSQLPYILDRAFQNDWRVFAAAVVAVHRAVGDEVARGMAFSVNCSESVPFIGEADIRRETEGTYLGDFDVRNYRKNCGLWPYASVPKSFLAPVRSGVPSLLISGAEDPATPPSMAGHAAEGLSHSRVVIIPNGTHLTGGECIDKMIVQFVEAASEAAVDAGCVNQIRHLPFLTLEQVRKIRGQAGQ